MSCSETCDNVVTLLMILKQDKLAEELIVMYHGHYLVGSYRLVELLLIVPLNETAYIYPESAIIGCFFSVTTPTILPNNLLIYASFHILPERYVTYDVPKIQGWCLPVAEKFRTCLEKGGKHVALIYDVVRAHVNLIKIAVANIYL